MNIEAIEDLKFLKRSIETLDNVDCPKCDAKNRMTRRIYPGLFHCYICKVNTPIKSHCEYYLRRLKGDSQMYDNYVDPPP